jgi:NADPH-dependent 7-cyano-7-deazaguanine reductase QueF-like protein
MLDHQLKINTYSGNLIEESSFKHYLLNKKYAAYTILYYCNRVI